MKNCTLTTNPRVSEELREHILRTLKQEGYQIVPAQSEEADFHIVVGGDGSFLRAVHELQFSEKPFLGINTGQLGFYQEVLPEKMADYFRLLKEGRYRIDRLRLVEGDLYNEKGDLLDTVQTVNEIAIRAKRAEILHLDLYFDDVFLETLAGDGVLFSTPGGSTAYNLSAGGAILYQQLRGYQITPLAPIISKVYRALNAPLVVPGDLEVRVEIPEGEREDTLIIADGNCLDFPDLASLVVRVPSNTVNRIVFNPDWYWWNLKDKFL